MVASLKKIEELNPGVVTLDLEMPGVNGMKRSRKSCGAIRCR